MKYAVFAKHLQAIPLAACAERIAAAGFQGLDLTARPGGYVQPGQGFESALRAAVKTARTAGLEVPLLTTGLTSAQDPAAEPTLRLAGELGIPHAKLHYWPCPPGTPLRSALDAAKRDLAGLAKIARKSGLKLLIHNHSGDFVTCTSGAVAELLADHEPDVVGAYLDPAHLTLEGGLSGWRFSLEALLPRVGMVALKDGKMIDPPTGAGPQQRRWVPVGTGNVRWPQVYSLLAAAGFNGWGSVHGEYQGQWSWRDLSADEVLDQCGADLTFLRQAGKTL